MKFIVTYEREDVLKLIERDLKTKGFKCDLTLAQYDGSASITVEIKGTSDDEDAEAPVAPAEPARPLPPPVPSSPVRLVDPTPSTTPEAPPSSPVDMAAILAESRKVAATTKARFPNPTRSLMEGESEDWPGSTGH